MSPKHEHACDSLDKDMLILSPMRALWGQSTTSEPGYAQASLQPGQCSQWFLLVVGTCGFGESGADGRVRKKGWWATSILEWKGCSGERQLWWEWVAFVFHSGRRPNCNS